VSDAGHVPVLLEPVLELLDARPGEVVVDATIGRGGHAAALAERVGPTGLVVGFDLDPENLAFARRRVEASGTPFVGFAESFLRVPARLPHEGRPADVLLADLGVASVHLDDPERGFSFDRDGPLDMRLDPRGPVTAARLVNELPERELARIVAELGEEPLARPIARKLVSARAEEPINRTGRLAQLVREVYGPRARSSRLHPATRTFMALRIAVNDELGALDGLLDAVTRGARVAGSDGPGGWLQGDARVGIISFHSLEDRRVKRCFADLERAGVATRLTRRPVRAGAGETAQNPRARSARLRVVRMTPPPAE
jgi:16S rRNA (cytosine1402-N4)-methyltransferase